MFIRFANGSTWQVIGSDNYDSLVANRDSWFSEISTVADTGAYLLPQSNSNAKNITHSLVQTQAMHLLRRSIIAPLRLLSSAASSAKN
jgi:hypothetical protein